MSRPPGMPSEEPEELHPDVETAGDAERGSPRTNPEAERPPGGNDGASESYGDMRKEDPKKNKKNGEIVSKKAKTIPTDDDPPDWNIEAVEEWAPGCPYREQLSRK